MITLYQPPPRWQLHSLSPFCVKLEAYLRMAKIPFKIAEPNLLVAPKGKIPYVKDGDGPAIGDSGLIIDYLASKYGDQLDGGMTPLEVAQAHAVRRMLEESTYFGLAWLRWSDPRAMPFLVEYFRAVMPPVVGSVIPHVIRRSMLKITKAQGVSRHSRDEVLKLVFADFRSLSALLGDRAFLMGADPRSVDATVYGFLNGVLGVPWESELKQQVSSHGNLVAYADRMRSRYWA